MSVWWIAALAWLAVFVATLGACAMAARADRRAAAVRAERRRVAWATLPDHAPDSWRRP